jgi:predicted NUDIX family NTP pyrophosphohydrolase
MPNVSAGLLLYRVRDGELEYLLAHPGGPLWKNRDAGVWTIPKGEVEPGEDLLTAARREFEEETGMKVDGNFVELSPIQQKSGKMVHAWAVQAQCDINSIRSNVFRLEWPPRSGNFQSFPEIDRAAFFRLSEAKVKINPSQIPLLEEFAAKWKDSTA